MANARNEETNKDTDGTVECAGEEQCQSLLALANDTARQLGHAILHYPQEEGQEAKSNDVDTAIVHSPSEEAQINAYIHQHIEWCACQSVAL